ncbi:pollen receptor-like kinase 4 [Zingiber officinale]|uniref:pollen receptor-like kinase 4 n=1 Tax=Zingiber officinale TaxID=94328 RepID=UPI001C4DA967|nr:pollen receptor-like kinase 4 [Zingiber officinale]
MADEAPPWPLQLLAAILSLFGRHPSTPEDSHVLLQFKASLSDATSAGPPPALASWGANVAPCVAKQFTSSWAGVFCDDARVSTLLLNDMSLAGELNLGLLSGLPGLRYLSFVNNSFDGGMPDITKLPDLKSIYLSRNRFSGHIKDDLFQPMRALKKVWLSHNNFSGPIPSSLVAPEKLMEVGLDGNMFEGEIPALWQPDLHIVNVAFNNLDGPIPARLANMSTTLFEGNKNLCGPPLAVPCPPSSSDKKPLSPYFIIGVILISIALLLLLIMLIICLLHRRRSQKEAAEQPQSGEAETIGRLETAGVQAGPSTAAAAAMTESHGGSKKIPKKEQGKLSFVSEERKNFDLQDLLRASAEVLGSGNFGSSYKASLIDGPAVVVKRFKEMNAAGREDFREHMRRLGRLSHRNLLPLVAYCYLKEEKLIITDYIPGGSLAHMLHGNNGPEPPVLDWPARLRIIKGIARGLVYLSDELPMLTLPHGHLKSSNVLLDPSLEPVLTDYALAPVMNKARASQVMVAYKSPECCGRHGKPSRKSDAWSFGILALEILTGKFPATYLRDGGSAASADLACWVNSVAHDKSTGEMFDPNMTKKSEGEMSKLLHIAMACCETNVDARLELKAALEKIEELRERDDDEDDDDDVVGRHASKRLTAGDELSLSR